MKPAHQRERLTMSEQRESLEFIEIKLFNVCPVREPVNPACKIKHTTGTPEGEKGHE